MDEISEYVASLLDSGKTIIIEESNETFEMIDGEFVSTHYDHSEYELVKSK
jgi:hypothetical protein